MRIHLRGTFAAIALMGLALVGCGGSGTQPTSLDRGLTLANVVAYPEAGSVGTQGSEAIYPVATFGTKSNQTVTAWGTRDTDGSVLRVRETAFTTTYGTVYARYDDQSAIESLSLVNEDGSIPYSIAFSPLQTDGDDKYVSVYGVENSTGSSISVRATLRSSGSVTLKQISGSSRFEPMVLSGTQASTSVARAQSRDTAPDPLAGLSTADQDSADRKKILTALLHVAKLLLSSEDGKHQLGDAVVGISDSLLTNEIVDGYQGFHSGGGLVSTSTTPPTTPAFRSDLPVYDANLLNP